MYMSLCNVMMMSNDEVTQVLFKPNVNVQNCC